MVKRHIPVGSPNEVILETLPYSMPELKSAEAQSSYRFSIPSELLKTYFHNSPHPLVLMKLANRTLIQANRSFLELTGFSEEELAGHHVFELNLLTEKRTFKLGEDKLKQGLSAPLVEQRLHTKHGAIKTVLVQAEPFHFQAEEFALVSFVDITATKRTEEQLCQALKATLADADTFTRLIMQKLARVSGNGNNNLEISDLTHREKQVLELIAEGLSNSVIAEQLSLAPHTIRNYISQVYEKLDLHSRAEAIVWARERGLVNHN